MTRLTWPGADVERLAEVEMVGQVAMERVRRGGLRRERGLGESPTRLVPSEGEIDRCLGVVALFVHVAEPGLDPFDAERPVVPGHGPLGALDVQLGRPESGHVALEELGLASIGPSEPDADLVEVGDVLPHPLVAVGHDGDRVVVHQLEDPVDVVTAPVVDGPAADRHLAVPGAARVFEAADEGLDVEDVADEAALDGPAKGAVVGVPPAVLVDRQRDAVCVSGGDQFVGLGDGDAHRLLGDHVLAGPQCLESERRMAVGRGGDHHDVDGVVVQQIGHVRVGGDAGELLLGGLATVAVGVDRWRRSRGRRPLVAALPWR